jgi:hypothetical protein
MRIFIFNKVIYDGYLTLDLIAFFIKQKFSRVFVFRALIPDFLKFLFRRSDITQLLEKVYAIILSNVSINEINLFKVSNIHKIDLKGFGISPDNKKDIIVTWEPSFLIDIFIDRNHYNVICTEYDLHTRKIDGELCFYDEKIRRLKQVGINKIDQLFIYSFEEKQLLNIADYIFVYRDHELIDYDNYEGNLRDRVTYNMANLKLVSYLFIAITSFIGMILVAGVASFFIDVVASFLIGYICWFIVTYILTVTYVNRQYFSTDHLLGYTLGIIPNFLLQLFFVILLCAIVGLPTGLIVFLGAIVSFPLLIFLIKFYKFA